MAWLLVCLLLGGLSVLNFHLCWERGMESLTNPRPAIPPLPIPSTLSETLPLLHLSVITWFTLFSLSSFYLPALSHHFPPFIPPLPPPYFSPSLSCNQMATFGHAMSMPNPLQCLYVAFASGPRHSGWVQYLSDVCRVVSRHWCLQSWLHAVAAAGIAVREREGGGGSRQVPARPGFTYPLLIFQLLLRLVWVKLLRVRWVSRKRK